jgi:hypothetical protein
MAFQETADLRFVVITPLGDTPRIRLFAESAMNRLPARSTASRPGLAAPSRSKDSEALVADPPSPECPGCPSPFPATRVIVPFVSSLNT